MLRWVLAGTVAGLLLGYGAARLWAARPYESVAAVRFVAPRMIGPELTNFESLGVPQAWVNGCTPGVPVHTSLWIEGDDLLWIRSQGSDARAAQCLASSVAARVMTMNQPKGCCGHGGFGPSSWRRDIREAEARLAKLRGEREIVVFQHRDVGPVQRVIDSEVARRDQLIAFLRRAEESEARDREERKRNGTVELVRPASRPAPREAEIASLTMAGLFAGTGVGWLRVRATPEV